MEELKYRLRLRPVQLSLKCHRTSIPSLRSPITMDTHLPALKWGEGSLIRVLWAERLEKPVITAQTACECDDIAVLAIYSQLVRKPHSRHHNIATLSPNSDVPLEIRVQSQKSYTKIRPWRASFKQQLPFLPRSGSRRRCSTSTASAVRERPSDGTYRLGHESACHSLTLLQVLPFVLYPAGSMVRCEIEGPRHGIPRYSRFRYRRVRSSSGRRVHL
jgi:hypothetical protein